MESWGKRTTTATAEASRMRATGRASCIVESIYTFAYDESTTTPRAGRRGALPGARAREPRHRDRHGARVEEPPGRGVPARPSHHAGDERPRYRDRHGQVVAHLPQDRLHAR